MLHAATPTTQQERLARGQSLQGTRMDWLAIERNCYYVSYYPDSVLQLPNHLPG